MNLKHLTDDCLLTDTKRLVRQERELLTDILHHLREIERRRLFEGKPSLHVYVVEVLKYSDEQAQRRITAMRLIKQMPQIEDQIQSGRINLTHLGMADSLFKTESKAGLPLTVEAKLEVIEVMAGQSTRKAQAAIQKFATQPIEVREVVKAVGDGRNAVTLELSDEVLAKLDQLKGWLAHKDPHMKLGDLIARLSDLGLEHLNPVPQPKKQMSEHTKAAIRRRVWARDQSACTVCSSRFALEEDHIVPASMGGAYTFDNIRLLCRSCNQRAAIEKLGLDKMDPFLSPAAPQVSVSV